MAAYDFPDTAGRPTDGSFSYTAPTGEVYSWNGYAWVIASGTNLNVYVKKAGDTMSGGLSVPANATATQVPQVQEVVKKAGDTMTGELTVPRFNVQANGNAYFAGDYLLVMPEGTDGTGMAEGTCPQDGWYVIGPTEPVTGRVGSMVSQLSTQSSANVVLTKKNPATTNAKYIDFWHKGLQTGSVTLQTATSVKFNTTSDYRLKENVVPIAEASSKLKQLKTYGYNFITNPEIPMLGFLAHEVAEVLPAVVTGEKDAVDEEGRISPQQMDYSLLTPILTAALQETLARVETLEAEVQQLKGGQSQKKAKILKLLFIKYQLQIVKRLALVNRFIILQQAELQHHACVSTLVFHLKSNVQIPHGNIAPYLRHY